MGQSTFQIDCSQISTILHCATPQSLVLIDEFGKGTNVSDGIALFTSMCSTLLEKKDQCPKTVCVTHFSEALDTKELAPYLDGRGIMHAHMASLQESDRLVPLFQLRKVEDRNQFRSSKSDYGLWCAKQANINERCLNRAKEIFECIDKGIVISECKYEKKKNNDEASSSAASKYRDVLTQFLSVDDWLKCGKHDIEKMMECINIAVKH